MKLGVILDRGRLARWQADALRQLGDCELIVYSCANSRRSRPALRNALYYALSLAALRTTLTKSTDLPASLKVLRRIEFECENDGQWQRLPGWLLQRIREDRLEAIAKFGMGLLRVPSEQDLPVKILSYHHGDPRAYRGRPAGFYEMLEGRGTVGQVVQILSNTLDAGQVLAFAETKVRPHSYRATMKDAYRCSPLLLRTALRNLREREVLPIEPAGRNYRLPGNATVARLVLRSLASSVRRLGYGAFFEKGWNVAQAPASGSVEALLDRFPPQSSWQILQRPKGYRFLADPFYHPSGSGVLLEALRRKTGLGEILNIWDDDFRLLCSGGGHYSYPAPISAHGDDYFLPEVADWSCPTLYRLAGARAEPAGELKIPGRPALVDATPFAADDGIFLFANRVSEGASVLRLWHADTLDGEFLEHPHSPIRISPAGSRMGGEIVRQDDALYRVGQDFRGAYGDGLILFRIEQLSRTHYREVEVGTLRFQEFRGPHTLNVRDGRVLFDFYSERFSPFAGFRRLRARMQKRRWR
jgi:hypothetical protein